MTKCKQRRSLHGAVLIMVLTVMVVLIIMLMATLTVVTTAGQRIYTKFEENQAYYTARSALDVFTENMLNDGAYYAYDNAGKIRLYESGVDMKQGLALQLDLYKIGSQEKSYESESNTELKAWKKMLENPVSSDGIFTDATDQKYFYLDTATGLEYIEYDITFPVIASSSNSYGKIVDISATDLDKNGSFDDQAARIKVEVLERELAHGEYTDAQIETAFKDTAGTAVPSKADILKSIADAPRSKDKMKLKITATVEFMGVEGVASVILDTQEPPANNSSRAITAMGTTLGTNHAYVVGGISITGVSSNPDATPEWKNGGGIIGTIYNETSFDSNTYTKIYLTESEYMFHGGDLGTTNDIHIVASSNQPLEKNKRPFILSYGTLNVNNKLTGVGGTTENEKVDLIVNGINWVGASAFKYNGDVYSYGSCTFNSTAGKPDINGDIYIKGDLTVDGNCATLDGKGTLTVDFGTSCNVHVSGNVIYKGAFYSPTLVTGVNSVDATAFKDLPEKNDILKKNGEEQSFDIVLPGGVKKKIFTHNANYSQYYQTNDDGDYIDADGDGNPDVKTAEELSGVDFTTSSTWNKYGEPTKNEIVTSASETQSYVIKGNSGATLDLKISGGGTVNLFLDPTSNTQFKGNIIVADDTKLNIYGTASGFDASGKETEYDLLNFTVWTQTVYNAYSKKTQLDVGSAEGHNIKVPKINYYFSDGTKVKLNGNCMLVGYFMSPEATLWTNMSYVKFDNLKYNGASVDSNWPFIVIGSVLCKDFEFQNDNGVAYINPSLDEGKDKGEPILDWKISQYTRK